MTVALKNTTLGEISEYLQIKDGLKQNMFCRSYPLISYYDYHFSFNLSLHEISSRTRKDKCVVKCDVC